MNSQDKFRPSLLYNVFQTVATIAFIAMVATIILQLLFRFALPITAFWTEELARLLNATFTFLGAVVVWMRRDHIRVDYLVNRLPHRVRVSLGLLVNLLMGWFMVSLTIGCSVMAQTTWNTFATTIPWWRIGYTYVIIGISAATIVMLIFIETLQAALFLVKGKSSSKAHLEERVHQ